MADFLVAGKKIIPVGANYLTLDKTNSVRTFDPGFYDAARCKAAFAALAAHGYNCARLFHWPDRASLGTGVDPAYSANVADAIKNAAAAGVVTILTCVGLPWRGYYPDFRVTDTAWNDDPYHVNWFYLTQTAQYARNRYLFDLLQGLQFHGVSAEMFLAIELTGELGFRTDHYPFTLSSGAFATKTGSYDLASTPQRQAMMEDNIVAYIDNMVGMVNYTWPGVPTMVQLAPQATNLTPSINYLPNAAVLTRAAMSAVGFSLYPVYGQSMEQLVRSFGVALPIGHLALTILEWGWTTDYGTVDDCAAASTRWLGDAASWGIEGNSYYTLDCPPAQVGNFMPLLDSGGTMIDALAPAALAIAPLPTRQPSVPPGPTPPNPLPVVRGVA